MNKAIALLSWQLNIICPHCKEEIDLADPEYDGEGDMSHHIFTNAWDKLKGFEIECGKCRKVFCISEVEY